MNNTEINEKANTIINEILQCFDDFCIEQNIDSIRDISQSVYGGMLLYTQNRLFKHTDRLKVKNNINNAYDTDLLSYIADFYIYHTKVYDKECSVYGFQYLTGISDITLYEWGRNASCGGFKIVKNIRAQRENSLSEKLQTGKNPVGVLAILNHFYGWSGVGNMQEDRQKQAATLTDAGSSLFELTDNSNGGMIESGVSGR